MKVIAAINADFESGFLGLPSKLNADLRGETVIRRTLERLRRTPGLASIHLLADVSQESAAGSAAAGLDVAVETHHAGAPPWTRYVASGRKWSLDAWRGGLAGTMVYDEYHHPWLLEALARREKADAVVDVPPAAPLLDPALLGELIQYYGKVREEVRLALVQSAPGLSAIVYHPDMLATLAAAAQPPGRSMAYRPEEPVKDAIHQACWFPADAAISHAWGRCIADTCTAVRRLDRILDELEPGDAEAAPGALAVSRWLLANKSTRLDALPAEVEVEITTEDPLNRSTLRPRGSALERAGEMEIGVFQRIVDDLAGCDDRLLVLGGFGDPLAHPQWPEFVRYARSRGILGIAIRTSAVNLDAGAIEALVESDLDVLNVLLDAATPETYRKVHRSKSFDDVVANLERLCGVQQQRRCPRPLIVCELLKSHETMDDLEAFYDRWIRKTASAVIAGPSHYAGHWPNQAVVRMAPPTRFPCLRLPHRATILADGRMTLCDQDFRGRHAVGSLHESRLAELWQGAALAAVRQNHLNGAWNHVSLCRGCEEWHRP